jgi:hypothetical protein
LTTLTTPRYVPQSGYVDDCGWIIKVVDDNAVS